MQDDHASTADTPARPLPWNERKLIGAKPHFLRELGVPSSWFFAGVFGFACHSCNGRAACRPHHRRHRRTGGARGFQCDHCSGACNPRLRCTRKPCCGSPG